MPATFQITVLAPSCHSAPAQGAVTRNGPAEAVLVIIVPAVARATTSRLVVANRDTKSHFACRCWVAAHP